jgi:hypothetical protein
MPKPYVVAFERLPPGGPWPPGHAPTGLETCSCHCFHPDDLTLLLYTCCGCGQKKTRPKRWGKPDMNIEDPRLWGRGTGWG